MEEELELWAVVASDDTVNHPSHRIDAFFSHPQGDDRTEHEPDGGPKRDPKGEKLFAARIHVAPPVRRSYWIRTTAGASAQSSSN